MKCEIKNRVLMLPTGFELPEEEMVLAPYVEGLKLYTREGWEKTVSKMETLGNDKKMYLMRYVVANADLISPSANGRIRLTGMKGEILPDGEYEMAVEEDVITIRK